MPPEIAIQRLKPPDPFAASLGRLGLFLLFLDAGFVIKTSLLDLGKEPLFGQLSFKVFDGLFDLIVTNNHFHNVHNLSIVGLPRETAGYASWCGRLVYACNKKKHLGCT
jgi:hypothetical protein